MIAVGNDVVDLADAGTPSPRFLARVLAPEERALVERSGDTPALVWRLWAAKEAAYKLWARADRELPFAHRRFRVDPDAGVVEHDGRAVPVSWRDGDGLVACLAAAGAARVASAVATVDEAEAVALPLSARERAAASGRPSLAVRLLAKRLLGELGLSDVEILRPDRRGPPEVWRAGRRDPAVALSLSHDGRFVGCAVALEHP